MVFILLFALCLSGCAAWEEKFETAYPDAHTLTAANGWQETMRIHFGDVNSMEELNALGWYGAQHGNRNYEYWCHQMLDFSSDECLTVHAYQTDAHNCAVCGVSAGVFTSGIETRNSEDKNNVSYPFTQAFGFFECEVAVPTGRGMWSAFWLQAESMGQLGNKGRDGSEIDVYESSFIAKNRTKTGHAIHYDGYGQHHRSKGMIVDAAHDLYDGEYHTYALLWTPESYVFFLDGVATWATNYGGVSRVPEFLRLTVEIRDTTYGPYGQKIGTFSNDYGAGNDFRIKSVRVYQNDSYLQHIRLPASF